MRRRDYRLVPVAAAAWLAAGVATSLPAAACGIALGLWAGALVLAAVGARWGRRRLVIALTLVATAAAAATASTVALAEPSRSAAASLEVGGGRAVSVSATVVGKAETTRVGDVAFDAQAHRVVIGERAVPVDVPIIVRTSTGARPDIGAEVLIDGTVQPARDGRRAVWIVRAGRGLTIIRDASGVLGVAAGLRHRLVAATGGLPEPGADLIAGLAVGDTSAVSQDLDAAMKASSLSHLTAVSGANCAIVVGLAFAAAAVCGARRGLRVLLGLVALGGFVVLVTPEPSVVRAAAMSGVAMLGLLLGRTGAGISVLCAGICAALVADPWLATSMGFALSAAATAALLILAGPMARGLARWMPRGLAVALSVPLAAQLACGPLLVLIDPTVSLYGVAANLLAAPAAPVASIVGLVACLAAPWPSLQDGLAVLAWPPAQWIAATAIITRTLPANALPWPGGVVGAGILALVGGAVIVLVVPGRSGRMSRLGRRTAACFLALVVGIAGGSSALSSIAGPLTSPRDWSVAACDVGQGDAILIRARGAVALVDTGPDPAPLRRCLDRLGVARIDLLVLTHFDLDHVGGVAAVEGRVGVLLHGPPATPEQRRLLDDLSRRGADTRQAHAGMAGKLGDASWTVLWPPDGSRAFPSGNQASVTLDVRGPELRPSIFLGDLDADAQRGLLRSGALRPPYSLVKVAHHGSADQAPELYAALHPAVAIVSVGVDNDYGHPRAETLDFLRADGASIARTDQEGLVLVSSMPRGLRVWHERAPPALLDTQIAATRGRGRVGPSG